MSLPNYVSYFFPGGAHVKVMRAVDELLRAKGYAVFIDARSQYAAYGSPLRCEAHNIEPTVCGCEASHSFVGFVHELTWEVFHPDRPLKRGEVVHHEVHRFDNRIKHLTKLTRSQHAIHHNQRRQKHAYRKRFDGAGLYRPHRPGRVVELSPEDPDVTYQPPPAQKKPMTFKQRVREVEKDLATQYPALYAELAHLDSGKPIPRTAPRADWRSKQTRKLGLRMPRLQCTPAEGAVVLAAIKHGKAEHVHQAIAAELKTDIEVIRELWNRPPVAVARDRWARHQRLPTVGRKTVRD